MRKILLALMLLWATNASAQITIPHEFEGGEDETIFADEVNENFATLAQNALNRTTGGSILGNITLASGVTIDGIDIGAALCSTCDSTFDDVTMDALIAGAITSTAPFSLTTVTAPQATIRYNSSNRLDISIGSTGGVTFDAVGAGAGFTFSDSITATFTAPVSSGTAPTFELKETDAAGDSKRWRWIVDGAVMTLQVLSDDAVTASTALSLARSTVNLTAITFGSGDTVVSMPGGVVHSSVLTPAELTTAQTAYAPTGMSTAYLVRLSVTGPSQTLHGIAGGAAGRTLVLCNVDATGADAVSIPIESGTETTAANRFAGSSAATPYVITSGECLTVIYDGTSSRWRIVSRN